MTPAGQEMYRRLKVREERRPPRGLDGLAFAGEGRVRRLRNHQHDLAARAKLIAVEMTRLQSSSDAEIAALAQEAAARLCGPHSDSTALISGLACTAIATQRTLALSPYPVQLQAALALFDGYLAEMATGEGKSLAIALAATLMGLTRLPCHVVTANDYLAERDAVEFLPLYRFFGLRSDFVTHAKEAPERAIGYAAAIAYTTPKELVADFLRDQLKVGRVQSPTRQLIRQIGGLAPAQRSVVMRGLHFGIIDEADSVLIDEAVTPLIISRPVNDPQLQEAMAAALQICAKLERDRHYRVDLRYRDVYLTDSLWQQLLVFTSQFPPWWRSEERFREAIRLTLLAREFYHRDIHYVVQDGKIELIDESTGRIMPHRTWRQGIHQAVETKEGLEPTLMAESLATLSFQRYFRCYPRLAGLSGTVLEAASEIWQNYHLPAVKIPTHRPVQRKRLPTRIFETREEASEAVVDRVEEILAGHRAVLIGTRTLKASEEMARVLTEAGIAFRLLNACRNAEEAAIIADAGQAGRVTIATNMAGRGTDIKLGPRVAESGGLHVIATECNPSGRIDRQLLGRAGRQGDPGSGEFILSLDDELLIKHVPAPAYQFLREYFRVPIIQEMLAGWSFTAAQWSAERDSRYQRRRTLESDTWLDEHVTFAGRSSFLR